ncbi:MAG: hypothetical protein AVDCRST_MAG17-1311, partial [uncultured Solirubrobacterales bacterium]
EHARLGDDGDRHLALHSLRARPLLGWHRRCLCGSHPGRGDLRPGRLGILDPRPGRDRNRPGAAGHPGFAARTGRVLPVRRARRKSRGPRRYRL